MSIKQLNFEGKNKVETAIMRLQNFEPPEGYWLADSGGKDSRVIYDLTEKSGTRFEAHHNLTTADPPELVRFIYNLPKTIIDYPPKTMWQLVEQRGLPRRQSRYCCEELKERGGTGRTVITGVRVAESKGHTRRARRKMVESCYKDTSKRFVNPIIDWSDNEVWEYIHEDNVPYCSLYDEGFKRLGCVLCPMVRDIEHQIERFPKTAEAWHKATIRFWNRRTKGGIKFKSAEALWQWWLQRDKSNDDEQPQFFD